MVGPELGPVRLRVERREPDIAIVHHSDEHGTWATRGRTILFLDEPNGSWRIHARFPRHSPLDALSRLRPTCRALRLDRCSVRPTPSGALLAIRGGTVYRVAEGRFEALCMIEGDCVMGRAIAEAVDGSLYLGEYFSNGERRPVRIWRLAPDLRGAEVVHELRSPRVRHVHAIHRDPFLPERLWFTTGDSQKECYVGYSDDGFGTVKLLGDGGQHFRAVGVFFEADHLTWCTDSHLSHNRVVRMERSTGQIEFLDDVASSSWYAVQTTDEVRLVTTTVEPGPGILTRQASLLASLDGQSFGVVASFDKDAWPMPWFKFGSLSLPSGRYSSQQFWLSGEGVRGLDGGSMLCGLEPATEGA